jgi:hypothetical protein
MSRKRVIVVAFRRVFMCVVHVVCVHCSHTHDVHTMR